MPVRGEPTRRPGPFQKLPLKKQKKSASKFTTKTAARGGVPRRSDDGHAPRSATVGRRANGAGVVSVWRVGDHVPNPVRLGRLHKEAGGAGQGVLHFPRALLPHRAQRMSLLAHTGCRHLVIRMDAGGPRGRCVECDACPLVRVWLACAGIRVALMCVCVREA